MQCEICGKAVADAKKIVIDGSEMLACEECAGFGVEKQERFAGQKIVFQEKELEKAGKFDLGFDFKKGFGKIIQHARQKQGLTLEELGKKIASIDWKAAKRDVENFLRPEEKKFVENWSEELYQMQIEKIELILS